MEPHEGHRRHNVPAARTLRRRAAFPERLLWTLLRGRRMAQWKFRRQHPVGPYVLDFYCPEARLAIELDGSYHEDPPQAERDRARQFVLEREGITFLRIAARDLQADRDAVVERILGVLQQRRPPLTPTLSPLRRGEGAQSGGPPRRFGARVAGEVALAAAA